MNSLIKVLSFIFILIFYAPYSFADKCTTPADYCRLENLPTLNQNDPSLPTAYFKNSSGTYYNSDKSTNLCGPTSLAVLIMASLKNSATIQVKNPSWIYDFFNASNLQKIVKAAELIDTTSSRTLSDIQANGTYPEEIYTAIYNAFCGTSCTSTSNNVAPVPYVGKTNFGITYPSFCGLSKNIQGYSPSSGTNLNNMMGVIIQLGHYFKTTNVSNGVSFNTYTRSGGHFIVLYGYTDERLDIYEVSGPLNSTVGYTTSERISRIYNVVKDDNGVTLEKNAIYYNLSNSDGQAMKAIDNVLQTNGVGYMFDRRDKSTGYYPIIESLIYVGTVSN